MYTPARHDTEGLYYSRVTFGQVGFFFSFIHGQYILIWREGTGSHNPLHKQPQVNPLNVGPLQSLQCFASPKYKSTSWNDISVTNDEDCQIDLLRWCLRRLLVVILTGIFEIDWKVPSHIFRCCLNEIIQSYIPSF